MEVEKVVLPISNSTFDLLPNEVIFHLLSFLEVEELLKMCLVSKTFHLLLEANCFIWKDKAKKIWTKRNIEEDMKEYPSFKKLILDNNRRNVFFFQIKNHFDRKMFITELKDNGTRVTFTQPLGGDAILLLREPFKASKNKVLNCKINGHPNHGFIRATVGLCHQNLSEENWRSAALSSFYTADKYLYSNQNGGYQSNWEETFKFGDIITVQVNFEAKITQYSVNGKHLGDVPFIPSHPLYYFFVRAGTGSENFIEFQIL